MKSCRRWLRAGLFLLAFCCLCPLVQAAAAVAPVQVANGWVQGTAEDGLMVPLQLQLLQSEMLPFEKTERAPNGNRIRCGIEFDAIGRRVAYHFRRRHPGDSTDQRVAVPDTVRVPAEEVLLPAPSACRSDRAAVAHLPLRLAVYAPEKDVPVVEALLNVLNAQGVLSGLSITCDKASADAVCSVEGTPSGTGEGYEARLERGGEGRGILHLKAAAPQGLFYAWQSMVQILSANRTGEGFSVPVFSLRDDPRFEWRGLMLDVSRHFFTMAEVKRMVDTMSLFKLNRLHLHLTDGPGWRLEIKKYPLLTSMSAWRVPLADGEWNWREVKLAIREHDPEATYGGFYTQEQMREIIAYARSRQVTVVPEIDLPGHSYAAMHAYGDLICDGVDFPVEGKQGRDSVCMGRPETLRFVKDVVDELKAVFPPGSPIHLGHDEVSAEAWKKCRYCQNRLKSLREKDLKALSRDFLQRIADYVRKDGYEAIV